MGLDAWKTVKNNGFGLIKTSSTAKSLNMPNRPSLEIYKLKINIVGPLRNLNTEDHDYSMSETLCLRGLGLASAEAMREIAPPELITGREPSSSLLASFLLLARHSFL
ncbi:hypothetical protein YC2023_042528 [Brassica napus]